MRYWAGARDAAGTTEQHFDALTLSEVLRQVREEHGVVMSRLIDVSALLVDGVKVPVTQDGPVGPESVVEILPPTRRKP